MERHEPGGRTGPAQDRESRWAGGGPLPAAPSPPPAPLFSLEPGWERGVCEVGSRRAGERVVVDTFTHTHAHTHPFLALAKVCLDPLLPSP